jgi:hypothetical protein
VRPDSSQERGTGVSRPPVSTVVAEIASGREDPRRASRADEALARRTQQLAVARREIAALKGEVATLRSKLDAAGAR